MFKILKVKVLRAMYNYYHNKAEYFFEKMNECESQGDEFEELSRQYRYYAGKEMELVEEIYLVESI